MTISRVARPRSGSEASEASVIHRDSLKNTTISALIFGFVRQAWLSIRVFRNSLCKFANFWVAAWSNPLLPECPFLAWHNPHVTCGSTVVVGVTKKAKQKRVKPATAY